MRLHLALTDFNFIQEWNENVCSSIFHLKLSIFLELEKNSESEFLT